MISLERCNPRFEPFISLVPCLPATTTMMHHSCPSEASSNDDDAPQQSQNPEYDKEDKYNDDAGSQVTVDTFDLAETDFLTLRGLNLFFVALPLKAERILLKLKNLPKTINPSGISKKNFRVTVMTLNRHIETLRNSVLSENATARSIHDAAKEALKQGEKSSDDVVKKMSKLKDDLAKTRAKPTNVSEKMRRPFLKEMPHLPNRRWH
jgi:hypothetical protein